MVALGHSSTMLWIFFLFFMILKSSADVPLTSKNLTLSEVTKRGTRLTRFDATGRGTCRPERISFGMNGTGCDSRLFQIYPSGDMVLKYALDYERQAKYECLVSVHSSCDKGALPMRKYHLTINVQDVNDNHPSIQLQYLTKWVTENGKPNIHVARVTIDDRDSGKNGEVTCSYENSTKFIVKKEKGVLAYNILTRSSFDREEKNSYKIHIVCADRGEPPLSSEVYVRVFIRDVNDNAPQIDQIKATSKSGKFVIEEGLPYPSTVAEFFVSDKDSGGYDVVNCRVVPPSNHFTMEHYIGAEYFSLVAKEMLDYEDINRYDLTVVCEDNGDPPFSDSRNISVHVIDANETPPKINMYPQTQDGEFEVRENKGHGTLVAHASVFDLDIVSQKKVNCTIDNPNFLLSQISDSNEMYLFYKILTAKTFDYESEKQQVIQMVCTDYADPQMRSMSNVTVNIVDVNDNPPEMRVLALSQVAEVKENPNSGVLVAHLSVADMDSGDRGAVECYVNSPAFRLYKIQGMDGAYNLFTKVPLVYEEKNKYLVELHCQDQGEPRRITIRKLTVNVIQ